MNNDDLYQEIGAFVTEAFPDATPREHIRKMIQEGYEVMEDPFMLDEYADCAIALFGACHKAGFCFSDLMSAVAEKFTVIKGRKWERLPDGTYQHIKEESK